MNENTDNKNILKQARIVGFTYFITTIIGLINNFIIKPGLYYNAATLLDSEFQFRIAQVLDLLMFALVMWMAIACYIVAQSINQNLAKIVFSFRAGEVFIGFTVVMISLAPLMIMKNAHTNYLNDRQLYALTDLFFNISEMGWNILFISMSIGAFLFMQMLTKSSYIPKWLGFWGLFTYASMFICFSLQVLLPKFPESLMFVLAPGAFFELLFGIWLLGKGINIPEIE